MLGLTGPPDAIETIMPLAAALPTDERQGILVAPATQQPGATLRQVTLRQVTFPKTG